MRYVVYCDESRHNGAGSDRYMAIGGLWVQGEVRAGLTKAVSLSKRSHGLGAEAKWKKVSEKRLEAYKALVDVFFDSEGIDFRVIVVDQSRVDVDRFHDGDPELGFYKFYYSLLEKWIEPGNEYVFLLDAKENKGADRYSVLKNVLGHKARRVGSKIIDLTVIDSQQSPLAQICDIFTGATAAVWCADVKEGCPKSQLVHHIEARTGKSLRRPTPGPEKCKFNVFAIDLRKDRK